MHGSATIFTSTALLAIRLYQRYMSPLKGFSCAYRLLTGRDSCSAYGYRVIERFGLKQGLILLRRRLHDCGEQHRAQRERTVSHRTARHQAQAGFCDAGCDLPSADCVSADCLCDACDIAELFKRRPCNCGWLQDRGYGLSRELKRQQQEHRRKIRHDRASGS